LSGSAAGSAAGSFFREDSEGTNTENMGNSGTGRGLLSRRVFLTRTGTTPDHIRSRLSLEHATSNSGTKDDSGKCFMTGTLTADPYLWR
jgi:hypothetical protein